ncbi:citrate/2-methylcitrate synthase [Brevundimonas sp.]|uniref:citrate/2-methylcitrate synthase n=1 Tax=Brevundimonas sp. TaxID=1871086 RepID=UPI002D244FF6|nr:citrate/2-methylcitrate synthase [Brevundimonas sp.]HYD26904.1 citrate/2-methylcitrate synthase [Brevundimonas sp.]
MQSAETASQAGRWIGRGEALARLGVKAQTLYAYVSRGRIAARPDPNDPRRSLYAVADIMRLSGDEPAAAGEIGQWLPPPEESADAEFELRSAVSISAQGRLFYRGMDAGQLAEAATLEDVARLLWDARSANPFAEVRPRVGATPGHSARGRLFAALARRAEEDAELKARSAEALRVECARVLDEAVDAVAGSGPRLFLHQRLARAWKVRESDAHLIRRALVLSADAGLDAPALATRAAADGGASPAGAALSGLATLAGSSGIIDLARASAWVVAVRRQAADAARRAHEAGVLSGFGDPAWPRGDPRAAALLQAVGLPEDLARAMREGEQMTGRAPTFGLALVAVARRLELPRDAAADLLMIGRLAGLLAHALDQTTNGSPIRARLRYVGPEPGAN